MEFTLWIGWVVLRIYVALLLLFQSYRDRMRQEIPIIARHNSNLGTFALEAKSFTITPLLLPNLQCDKYLTEFCIQDWKFFEHYLNFHVEKRTIFGQATIFLSPLILNLL